MRGGSRGLLFHDRLTAEERQWCEDALDACAMEHFPRWINGGAPGQCCSNWMALTPAPRSRGALGWSRALENIYEEELDVELVVFDEVLDHVLRIDRVLRQPWPPLLVSGAGKTVLSRFRAWMNGLSVFQIKIGRKYFLSNFNED